MKIAMIGSGSWGSALAVLLGKKGYRVTLWARRDSLARDIESARENSQYLPGITLPDTVSATSSIDHAIEDATTVVLAIPSKGVREVLMLLKGAISSEILLVHAGKGLESGTGLRGSEVIGQLLGEDVGRGCVALSGPNLAVELANEIPTATVVASSIPDNAVKAQSLFSTTSLRAYRNRDIAGVELGGALKNIYAIGAGISDGLGYGDNTKATLVTRGLVEMVRLGVALGADDRTFKGLSGLGDLMATCSSPLSRNLRLGRMLGQGNGIDESLDSLGQVAEGMPSCQAAFLLSQKLQISMPICEQIYSVLFGGKSPKPAVLELMARDYRDELS